MKKIIRLVRDKRGAFHVWTAILIVMLLVLATFVTEVLRVHGVQQHLDDELYRAANLGIKTAMYDSYRQDSVSKFDEATAEKAFYEYLYKDMGLDREFEKFSDGELVYAIQINNVIIDGSAVRMKVEAVAYVSTAFKLWKDDWEIPLDVISRNMRVD